jgi:hypothetical protein
MLGGGLSGDRTEALATGEPVGVAKGKRPVSKPLEVRAILARDVIRCGMKSAPGFQI